MSGIWGYDWKLRGIIILQNIVIIAVLVGVGWLLDMQLQTKPLWMFVFLAFSFFVNQVVSMKIIARYIAGKESFDPTDPKNISEKQ